MDWKWSQLAVVEQGGDGIALAAETVILCRLG